MSKRFKAEWGNDYFKPGKQEVGSDFFTDEVGYSSDDRAEIDALAVGQEWQSSDGSNHTVTRLS